MTPIKASIDGGMIAVAGGWLFGVLPHLAWIVPTVYYGVQLWIVIVDRWFTKPSSDHSPGSAPLSQ